MLNRLSKFYLLYFCLLVLGTLKSQYDTTHYIPYLADLTGQSKMANLEYQDSFNGAYFMFSTFEAGTTNIKVYSRNSSGSGWNSSHILNINISPGSPYTWSPGNSKVQEFFSKTTICFPKIYTFESYSSSIDKYASENTPYTTLGVVFYNKKTGERTKVRNPVYENVRQLKGNEPKLQFHYLTLRQQGKVKDFLNIFTENKIEFMKFRDQVHTFTHTLFQNYVNCYIKKEKPLGDYGQQYKTHMFNIHKKYKTELKEKKMIVNNGVVIDYVNNLEPQLLMYCLNYDFRIKPEQPVEQLV